MGIMVLFLSMGNAGILPSTVEYYPKPDPPIESSEGESLDPEAKP